MHGRSGYSAAKTKIQSFASSKILKYCSQEYIRQVFAINQCQATNIGTKRLPVQAVKVILFGKDHSDAYSDDISRNLGCNKVLNIECADRTQTGIHDLGHYTSIFIPHCEKICNNMVPSAKEPLNRNVHLHLIQVMATILFLAPKIC